MANGQLETEPGEFALHVLVTVRGGEDATLGIALLDSNLFERLLCFTKFCVYLRQRGLRLVHFVFELQDFGVKSAQLALHAERTRFIRAAASNHAALIACAVGCDESELGIVARQSLGGGRAIRQIARAQPR